MALKKNDLVQLWEAQSQGLSEEIKAKILKPTGRGNRYAARDYIHANAVVAEALKDEDLLDLSSVESYEDLMKYIHPAFRFRLKHYTPCLAFRYDELKPDEQKKFFEDKNWVFTEKMNGARGWLISYKGDTFLMSRNYSDVDCSVPDYWGNIAQELSLPKDEIFAIDVEIMFEPGQMLQTELSKYGITTDSRLEAVCALLQINQSDGLAIQNKFKTDQTKDLVAFRLIHPLYYKGVNYIKKPLGEGQKVYDEVIEYAQKYGLNLKSIKRCAGNRQEKEVFVNTIIDEGGEGIVGHYVKGPYATTEKRNKTSFVKLKRSVGASAAGTGMGDTIDGWISGFKLGSKGTANENLVSSFEVSIYLLGQNGKTKEHIIAYVPNVAKEVSLKATQIDEETGKITMNPAFYNVVVECDGQAISKVSKRLTHPRLLNYRFDKQKNECIYTEEFIESQIDTL